MTSLGQDVHIIHICCCRCLAFSCCQSQRKSYLSSSPKQTCTPLIPFTQHYSSRDSFYQLSPFLVSSKSPSGLFHLLKHIFGNPWIQVSSSYLCIVLHPSQPTFFENQSILPHPISSPPLSTIAWPPHRPPPGHSSHQHNP